MFNIFILIFLYLSLYMSSLKSHLDKIQWGVINNQTFKSCAVSELPCLMKLSRPTEYIKAFLPSN